MFLNAQSVRNKVLDICDYIMQANVDLVFLCETWLLPLGDEADCAASTPPGFCLKSLPRQPGTGGGLAVLHRTILTRNIAVSTRDFVFTSSEICEVRLSYDGHTAVFLSVYRPLLFKGCNLAATAGLWDITAGLANPGTLYTLPTFTQPSHELRLCVS